MRFFFSLFLNLITLPIVHAQQDVDVLGELPEAVSETSGLIFYNGRLITHNDSGNTPQLFEIDTVSLQITRTVTIGNATNIDWEDMAQDDEFIYIGDFGNNRGTRRNLSIYKISKREYTASDTVEAKKIAFSYEDQMDFTENDTTDWDAEALVVFNNMLIVYTKQWQSKATAAYGVPKVEGSHNAKLLGTYPVNGLVTGATFNTATGVLYLCGYSSFLQPFIVRAVNLDAGNIFGDSQEKITLTTNFAQIESIAWVDENNYFLSSEFFTRTNPPLQSESRLFWFTTKDNLERPDDGLTDKKLIIHRALHSPVLQYVLQIDGEVSGRAIYDASGKQVQYVPGDAIENESIELWALQKSIYYLTFYYNGGIISKPFIWN